MRSSSAVVFRFRDWFMLDDGMGGKGGVEVCLGHMHFIIAIGLGYISRHGISLFCTVWLPIILLLFYLAGWWLANHTMSYFEFSCTECSFFRLV